MFVYILFGFTADGTPQSLPDEIASWDDIEPRAAMTSKMAFFTLDTVNVDLLADIDESWGPRSVQLLEDLYILFRGVISAVKQRQPIGMNADRVYDKFIDYLEGAINDINQEESANLTSPPPYQPRGSSRPPVSRLPPFVPSQYTAEESTSLSRVLPRRTLSGTKRYSEDDADDEGQSQNKRPRTRGPTTRDRARNGRSLRSEQLSSVSETTSMPSRAA